MTGGIGGLFSTWYIEPRIDRFSPSKKDDFKPNNIVKCLNFLIYRHFVF